MSDLATATDLARERGQRRHAYDLTRPRPTVPCCPVCAHLDAVPHDRIPATTRSPQ